MPTNEFARAVRVIVEDSNSGFEFFCGISDGKEYEVISAEGKFVT